MSSNIKELIRKQYIHKDFKEELYNTHPSELFSNYGGFVLKEFATGGKATALYVGIYQEDQTTEIKEKNMNNEINASFGFKYKGKDGNASGDLTLGRNNNSNISVTNKFTSILMAIKTCGGSSAFAAFSTPKEVKNTSVDLSGWISSLNDRSNHNIIEFGDDGLIPISDFIVEKNLKDQIKSYYSTGVTSIKRLEEPYIVLRITSVDGRMAGAATYLHTRFGNEIIMKVRLIAPFQDPNLYQYLDQYAKEEAERISQSFKIKVKSAFFTPYSSIPDMPVLVDLYNEAYLKKFVYNGFTYLINESGSALQIHKDQIINEYGIRELVNRLPVINIDPELFMSNYTIYAL